MKIFNKFLIFITILVLNAGIFTGCGINAADCIAIVRDGHFNSNPSIKIGNAFDQYFKNGQWKAFKATDDTDVVEFTGEFAWKPEIVTAIARDERLFEKFLNAVKPLKSFINNPNIQQSAHIYIQFILNENEYGNFIFNVQQMEIEGIAVNDRVLKVVITNVLNEYKPISSK